MAALNNPRHEAFVQNLIKGMSQRQAYKSAFPRSKKSPAKAIDNRASALLKKDEVKRRYEELQLRVENGTVITAQELLKGFTDIFNGEATEIVVTPAGIKVKAPAKISDRISAGDKIAKMLGAYDTRLSVEGQLGVVFVDDLGAIGEDLSAAAESLGVIEDDIPGGASGEE